MTSESHPAGDPSLAARITELEILLTQLQQMCEDLDSVVVDHGKRLDALEARTSHLKDQLLALAEEPVDTDERPATGPPG